MKLKDFNADVSEGKVENFNVNETSGIGLRIFSGRRIGFGYTTDLSNSAIESMISMAEAGSTRVNEDPFNRMPGAAKGEKPIYRDDIYDKTAIKILPEEKVCFAKAIEQNALKHDKRIKKVLRASVSTSEYMTGIINSAGLERSGFGTFSSVSIEVIAKKGNEIQTGGDFEVKRFYSDINTDSIINNACFRAISLLDARRVASQEVPVIFDPLVSCEFLEVIAQGLCADMSQKGKSVFINKIGEEVASPLLNIIDDGTLLRGTGTFCFDAEGTTSQKTVLIERGVLKSFLHNDYTAAKSGIKSTANAVRTFKETPRVGFSNLFIEPGANDRESLLNVEKGIYVFGVMGIHMMDPVSGDFSVGVNGLWIENGSYSHAVSGVTMAGNLFNLLNSIDSVASDIKFYGNIGAPTIRISNLILSGN